MFRNLLFKFSFTFSLLLLFFLSFKTKSVYAQSCSGTGSSTYPTYDCQKNIYDLYFCHQTGTVTNTGSCYLYYGQCVFTATNEPWCQADPVYGCTLSNQCGPGKFCGDPCYVAPTPTNTPTSTPAFTPTPTITLTPTPTYPPWIPTPTNTPTSTPKPPQPPPTATNTPTPKPTISTTPPVSAPTCGSITGPTCVHTNETSAYIPSCVGSSDGSSALVRVDMWFTPTTLQSGLSVYSNAPGNQWGYIGPSAPATVTWPSAGDYYIFANAWNANNLVCSGNPFITSWPYNGASYCGPNDLAVVHAYDPINLVAPTPLSPIGDTTCGDLPSKSITINWGAVAGAERYALRVNDTDANGWNGNCNGGQNSGDICDDNVVGTSYTFNAIPGHHYDWWVHALATDQCTGGTIWSASSTPQSFYVPVCGKCSVTIPPIFISNIGNVVTTTASVTTSGSGSVTGVDFGYVDPVFGPSVVGINPLTDSTSPYQTDLTAVSYGDTQYTATATVSDGVTSSICFSQANVYVTSAPWFQIGGGNAIIKGGLTDAIPPGPPPFGNAWNTNFITDPAALLVYNGLLNLDSGTVSSKGASANTQIKNNSAVSFDFFYNRKLPDAVKSAMTTLTSNSLDMTTISATCATVRGYHMCYYDGTSLGDLTLTGNYSMADGERDVLFVNNANVTITGSITPVTRGKASFMLISKGNISIDPTVGGSFVDYIPDIEAVLYTDGIFDSGHDVVGGYDNNLHIRGAVSAGSFNLGRTLSPAGVEKNTEYPGEYFEYGTEQVLAIPPFFDASGDFNRRSGAVRY